MKKGSIRVKKRGKWASFGSHSRDASKSILTSATAGTPVIGTPARAGMPARAGKLATGWTPATEETLERAETPATSGTVTSS